MRSIKVLVQKHSLFIEQAIRTRLYNKGTYSDGSRIKTFSAQGSLVYSPFTVIIKGKKGQPTDRVTLKDTGGFYKTFDTKTGDSEFVNIYDETTNNGEISDNVPRLDEAIQLGQEGMIGLQELITEDLRYDFKKEAREAILHGFE